jgi:flagellar basal body rod protein FlgC
MLTNSIQGIRYNAEAMAQVARRLKDFEKADTPTEMVNMMVAEHGMSANVSALKTALRMQDTILDLLA